jgi:hypothetical protein
LFNAGKEAFILMAIGMVAGGVGSAAYSAVTVGIEVAASSDETWCRRVIGVVAVVIGAAKTTNEDECCAQVKLFHASVLLALAVNYGS